MPNTLDADGLVLRTRQELIDFYTLKYQTIYGSDINLDSDSPDGQMMNIWVQEVLDMQDLLLQIFNSFDPDNALGVVLDQRIAFNGIQRRAGTYSTITIQVVTTASLNLYGLDDADHATFTVADNAGTQWQLQSSQLGLAAGTHNLQFRAKDPGAVDALPTTITVPVTVIVGVSSVTNPSGPISLGIVEETDAAVKIRRQKSVAIGGQGWQDSLRAALQNLNDVSYAEVYENVTGSTDADGIPSHSIWVVIAGSAADADIASVIYYKRNAGAGMKGSVTYSVIQSNGQPFTVKWDLVALESLYIKFTATSIDGVTVIDTADIKAKLVAQWLPGIYETLDVNELATKVQAIDPNCLVTIAANQGLSLTGVGAWTNFKTPSAKNKQFELAVARITIV